MQSLIVHIKVDTMFFYVLILKSYILYLNIDLT